MSIGNRSHNENVKRLLAAIEPASRQRKVRQAVDNHFRGRGKKDLRGRKSPELKKVATTLRHIVGMQHWIEDTRYDLNIRRRIKKSLKHIDHNQSWFKTVLECRKARGLVNRAARTFNEQKEHFTAEATTLDEVHRCIPLNSVTKLLAAGRRGGNCLQYRDSGYAEDLRCREAEFYEVHRLGEPVAWMSVSCESPREIREIYGPSNEKADLPKEVLIQICKTLDAIGDDNDLFWKNGVLSIFLDGTVSCETPMLDIRGYRIWSRTRQIAIHDSHRNEWSLFIWDRDACAWDSSYLSNMEKSALDVLCRFDPRIELIVKNAEPDSRRQVRRQRSKNR